MIQQVLHYITTNYLNAKSEKFENNSLAQFIREEAKQSIKNTISSYTKTLVVESSAGQSKWSDVPWIAILDPFITDSVQREYYVVYLFSADMESIYLCLIQGITETKKEILLQKSNIIRLKVPEYVKEFSDTPIKLNSASGRPKAYESGVAFHKHYKVKSLPSEEYLHQDLINILKLYETLIYRGGLNIDDEEIIHIEDDNDFTVEEKKLLRIHKVAERSATLVKKVKKHHGYICQVCNFNFHKAYGDVGKDYIEAHHLIPFSELKDAQKRTLDVRKDFAVLCANCHRMMHRKNSTKDINQLRQTIADIKSRKLDKS